MTLLNKMRYRVRIDDPGESTNEVGNLIDWLDDGDGNAVNNGD